MQARGAASVVFWCDSGILADNRWHAEYTSVQSSEQIAKIKRRLFLRLWILPEAV